MKKFHILLFAFVILFTGTACNKTDSYEEDPQHSNSGNVTFETKVTEGLEFELDENRTSYTLVGIGRAKGTADGKFDVVIPKMYDDLPVTSIADEAFQKCPGITSMTIPNSVTSIGQSTFNGCSNLISVIIPNSVNEMDCYKTFKDCVLLETVCLPDSVTKIGYYSFSRCYNLKNITIPSSVTCIEDSAFKECTSLTNITIPNKTTDLYNFAFYACKNLKSVTIPNSVRWIGDYVFSFCENLENIYFLGTESEWNSIHFGENWDLYTGNYTIEYID